jgi:hypothetical protein
LTSGPNGDIRWLNCGLSPDSPDSGWTPPSVSLDDIVIYAPGLDGAVNQTSSPFSQCKQFVDDFKVAGTANNVSAFFLAAFALQESGCRADAVADAGTYGLMQLSQVSRGSANGNLSSLAHYSIHRVLPLFQEKCVNVDCLDPKVNIKIGAAYLKQLMDANPNNLFAVIGAWNGWYPGMTYNNVISHRSSCCYCQQNLD